MSLTKPLTLIIADDDPEDREILKALFQNNSQFTLTNVLESGREVFDEISRKKNIPDILLIDMYMPFFNGIEVVKALDSMHAGDQIVKFVISSIEMSQAHQLDNPNIIFLRKPIRLEEMKALPNFIVECMILRDRLQI